MRQYRTCYQLDNGEWHPEGSEYEFDNKRDVERHVEDSNEYFANFTDASLYPLKIQEREVSEWRDV